MASVLELFKASNDIVCPNCGHIGKIMIVNTYSIRYAGFSEMPMRPGRPIQIKCDECNATHELNAILKLSNSKRYSECII